MKSNTSALRLTRRSFMRRSAMASAAVAGAWPFAFAPRLRAQAARPGIPLRLPPEFSGDTLAVAPASLAIWPGYSTAVQAINGSVPGPTIRVRRGTEFAARVVNQLAEPLVLHWHGLLAPERMDGHPRDSVAPGQSYQVRFPVNQRAATCWYHAHTDQLTAEQAYRGVAGLFIVEDPDEMALGLPSGDHDLPLVLTDKRSNAQRQLTYAPAMMDFMTGFLGDIVLVNGTPEAWLSVDQGLYRFRLLNGSNARIFKVGFADGHPFHLVATDGGLLPAPVQVTRAMLAPGQRLEILVDFSSYAAGGSVLLKTLSFPATGMGGMMGMMGAPAQGTEMDLLRFHVDRAAGGAATPPATLVPFTPYDRARAQRTRVFTLAMSGTLHTINGQLFNLQRVDFAVPFGDLELWEYRNTGTEPHPMHLHAAHCQIVERSGQAQLPPEDAGWKDTVLVDAGETVRVLVRFDAYPGVFVHHCHNLEHEDSGMMQNFEVLPPPPLAIQRTPGQVKISWPDSAQGYQLEATPSLGTNAAWQPVAAIPVSAGGRWEVTLTDAAGRHFYRLIKPAF